MVGMQFLFDATKNLDKGELIMREIKRLISVFVALIMVIGIMPTASYATGGGRTRK